MLHQYEPKAKVDNSVTSRVSVSTGNPQQPVQQNKIVRVRSGCWTCKARRRKCDETKPACMNCVKNNRECEGYDIRLSFDVDDSRHHASGIHFDVKGRPVVGFRRRPRLKESLAARKKESSSLGMTPATPVDVTKPQLSVNPLSSAPTGKELKFVVQSNFDNSRRSRRRKSQEQDGTTKKIKAEFTDSSSASSILDSNVSSTSSSGLSTPESAIATNFIKQESDCDDFIEDLTSIDNIVKPQCESISSGQNSAGMSPQPLSQHASGPSSPEKYVGPGMLWNVNKEEQYLLQYYFTEVAPLLDNKNNAHLAGLAITFCTHELSLSSFLCLAFLHLAKKQNNDSYYAIGLEYHSKTINFLGKVLSSVSFNRDLNGTSFTISPISMIPSQRPANQRPAKMERGYSVAALTVIYFLITFEKLDTGRSSTVRSHLAAFASIIKDRELASEVLIAPNGSVLYKIFAWYDILLSACSKDYRSPLITGNYFAPVDQVDDGLESLMGCPTDIMFAISEICQLRHTMKYNPERLSLADIQNQVSMIETRIRNYSSSNAWNGRESYNYVQQVIGSQCWAQAATVFLLRSTGTDPSGRRINKSVEEYLKLYYIMQPGSEIDRHMIWPLFVVGCELKVQQDQCKISDRIDNLFNITCCGSFRTLNSILSDVWRKNCSWEEVLSQKEWEHIDFLAL
ncbi:fungal-specific transcription factor domain-containing protein [Dipodascopsis uninucleata]